MLDKISSKTVDNVRGPAIMPCYQKEWQHLNLYAKGARDKQFDLKGTAVVIVLLNQTAGWLR